jgi:hypothetical protein
MVAATLMKPNYALIIVPTAALLAGLTFLNKDRRMLRFILLATLLPGLMILGGQFLFTYISPNVEMGQSHIIFAPLVVFGDRYLYLFLKFILSILFPLCVAIMFWKLAIKDPYFQLGLLVFVFGAAQSYLLAEEGSRMYFGNFLWSEQLGLFLWFIVSIRLVVQRLISDHTFAQWSPRLIVLSAIFALHVASGIIWYAHETIAPGAYW